MRRISLSSVRLVVTVSDGIAAVQVSGVVTAYSQHLLKLAAAQAALEGGACAIVYRLERAVIAFTPEDLRTVAARCPLNEEAASLAGAYVVLPEQMESLAALVAKRGREGLIRKVFTCAVAAQDWAQRQALMRRVWLVRRPAPLDPAPR